MNAFMFLGAAAVGFVVGVILMGVACLSWIVWTMSPQRDWEAIEQAERDAYGAADHRHQRGYPFV